MKKYFKDKTILITGGTGFLGRALIKEILKYNPKRIRIFSRDEVKHYQTQEMFKNNKYNINGGMVRNLIGDVRDYERLKKAMQNCDIVIHAAALKRIDMIEYNVEESIKTNIVGTLNVVNAALENKVEKVIFISTDKACSPINTYGACKFVSERIFVESNYNKGSAKTSFICVRYGNVINSTGSVIPFFINKIKNNEEIPLTDERMTRFLITDKQAVNLVFRAIKFGIGGEVFIPKLPSFNMINLIEYLKERFNGENKIKMIGLRPGEKIHELMVNKTESPRTYEFENCLIISSQIEKYQKKKKATYLKKARKINFEEYSSENNLLKGEKLKKYLDKVNL